MAGRRGAYSSWPPGCGIYELQTPVPGRAQLSGGCGCSLGSGCQLPPPQPQFHVSGGCETFMISLEMGFSGQSPVWKPQAWLSQPLCSACPAIWVPLDIRQLEPRLWVGMGGSLCLRRGRGTLICWGSSRSLLSLWDQGFSSVEWGYCKCLSAMAGARCPAPVLQTPSPLGLPEVLCGPPLSPKTCCLPWALPSRLRPGETRVTPHAGVTMWTTQAARDPGSHGAPAGHPSRWALPISVSSGTRKAWVPGGAATPFALPPGKRLSKA